MTFCRRCAFLEVDWMEGTAMKKSAARRFSVVRTLRHVRIRYRLLASFLLLSLVPALCVGLYASGVYARAMSGKLRQSAEQSAYLLNENFITELNKFRGYLNTISVTDAVQNALSAQQESAFTLDAESVNEMKTEMDQLSRIRSHIRKVMPGVLEARDEEDRRTFADYTEQQANQQELDELLQRTADQAIAHGSADDAPEQPEVIPVPTRSKGAQSHDEAR